MQQLCFPAVMAKAKLWRYSIPGVLSEQPFWDVLM